MRGGGGGKPAGNLLPPIFILIARWSRKGKMGTGIPSFWDWKKGGYSQGLGQLKVGMGLGFDQNSRNLH